MAFYNSAYISNGDLYYFGDNSKYNFGNGSTNNILVPTKMSDMKFKMVTISENITLALTENGDLYGCGMNYWGGLIGPVGNNGIVSTLTKISDIKFKYISCGYGTSMAISETGDLYAWGLNQYGKLGDGTTVNKTTPTKIGSLKWKSVFCGYSYSAGITENGDLYTWGRNNNGQIGDGTTVDKTTPTKIGSLKWKSVSCSSSSASGSTLAISETGDLYAWGYNGNGQLGDGTTVNKTTPTKIGSLKWEYVSCGVDFSAGVTTDGDLYTWGNGYHPDGALKQYNTPTKYIGLKWKTIVCGSSHSLGFTTNGDLCTWGLNSNGQLGDGTTVNILTPKKILVLKKNAYIVDRSDLFSFIVLKSLLKSNNRIYSLKSDEVLYETKMTSNTTPVPFVASASSEESSYGAWKAFNGTNTNGSDAWLTKSVSSAWIQIDFGAPMFFNTLTLNHRIGSVNYAPKNIEILVSNDNLNFTKLLEYEFEYWSDGEQKNTVFPNGRKYRYYKINMLTNMTKTNFFALSQVIFGKYSIVNELPSDSLNNFLEYGVSEIKNFNIINNSKNYILQDTVSEDIDGLWTTKLDRKPLSIKFE